MTKRIILLFLSLSCVAFGVEAIAVQAGDAPSHQLHLDAYEPIVQGSGAGYAFYDSTEDVDPPFRYTFFRPFGSQSWTGDNEYWTTTLPFDFRFCGQDYPSGSTIYISSNGIIGFSEEAMDEPVNQNLPNPDAPNGIIAAFWDDLYAEKIFIDNVEKYELDGLAITFRKMYFADEAHEDQLQIQVVLYSSEGEGYNNRVEIYYYDTVGDSWRDYGASATVGIENQDGSEAALYLFNQPDLTDLLGVRFIDQLLVESQLGAFDLLTPADGAQIEIGVPTTFSWSESDYSGSGDLTYTLLLADNEELTGAREVDAGTATSLEVVFGSFDIGNWFWSIEVEESQGGNTRLADSVWGFEVLGDPADTDAPTVGSQSPAPGSSDVPGGTNVVFHCYDATAVDSSTIAFTLAGDDGGGGGGGGVQPVSRDNNLSAAPRSAGEISGTLNVNDSNPQDVVCTFTPDADLPTGDYTCTVAAGLADTLGNATTSPVTWTFSTAGSEVVETSWGALKADN